MAMDWSGLNAQVTDLLARDQRQCELSPRVRSWFADLAERYELPDVKIELDATLYDRQRHGEFEALRSGELVIRIYPYRDEGDMYATLEHEAAHLLRYSPQLDRLRTADCHDAAFDRALTWIRSGVAPSGGPPRPRPAVTRQNAARGGEKVGGTFVRGTPAWRSHGALHCQGVDCEEHAAATPQLVRSMRERGMTRVAR